MFRILVGINIAVFASAGLFAQSATAPAFDVASVRPVAVDSREPLDFRIFPGGRLHITNLDLKIVLQEAYGIKHYQLSGGPAWIETDRFDIDAKAEGNPSRAQMMTMLQTLLADRFALKVHRESKEGNVYALVVAKGGPKFKESTAQESYIRLYRNTPVELPGVDYTLGAQKASMSLFADRLNGQLQRPVLDRTGLTGEFDFKVRYATDDNPETGPPLLVAIQEQLGLKLETTKGLIETLVIDYVEKPSGN